MSQASDPVLFSQLDAGGGRAIGIATLNSPATLNALSLDIVQRLDAQLAAWAGDERIVAVWLDAAGDKAFCAGGDLQRLHASMREAGDGENAYAAEFFAGEYRLDYRVHRYPKPVIAWMHGIVMGGGIGLACGAAHRVVTERSMLAMPEIGIGLFPDVGGSWFLGRMPGGIGRYLALTGARLNAADALFANMADLPLPQNTKDAVRDGLRALPWRGEAEHDHALVRDHLQAAADWSLAGNSALAQRFSDLARIGASASMQAAAAAIQDYAARDEWAQPHARTLAAGAPSSAALGWALQQRLAGASLAEVLRTEYAAALGCCAHGDFVEGIRALLIDKDKSPRWNPATLEAADAALVDALLQPRWQGEHPLADLESLG